MRLLIFSILIVFFSNVLYAQFTDDFSDGDFSNNPTWIGNTNKFIVNTSNELQLFENPQAAGTSYLSTESTAVFDASWEFFVKFNFNPSSTNYCDVYLCSNNLDLTASTQGYFVRLGNTADEVSLYRKNPTSSTIIIDGADGRLNSNTVVVRVKVTRDFDGNWTLMSDTLGGTNYYIEGQAFDNNYVQFSHFGVLCVYTSTRSQHMFFDDFVVTGTGFVDNEPPYLVSLKVLDNQNLLLTFSENLDPVSALDINNYLVNNFIGQPDECFFFEGDPSKVQLVFSNSFASGQNYTLFYQNIKDLSNNVIVSDGIAFSYVLIEPRMIVINEIMADPDPPVELPNAEYVELFNTTSYSINIGGWTYRIGTSSRVLEDAVIAPNGYLILCHTNNVSDFEVYGNVLGVSTFPAISNTGETITLFDDTNQIIDQVSYSDRWYNDNNKKNGGWSLEKIDPLNNCAPHTNWTASNDESGGSPGRINSVYAVNIDNIKPYVLGVDISAANELRVTFSEPVDSVSALNLNNYFVDNDLDYPIYVAFENTSNISVLLQFPFSFPENIVYIITISNIKDFCGNVMETSSHNFINYSPKEFDILITEIMANPVPSAGLPEAEYVELHNRTQYPLNLNGWKFTASTTTKTIPNCPINPGDYIVLTKTDFLSMFQELDTYDKFVGVDGFPVLSNSGTSLVLRDKTDKIIHTVFYSDTWYKDNFKKNGGYSLEMIDINNPCEGGENWRAAIPAGTPGKQNSVYGTNPDITRPYPIAVDPVNPDSLIVYFNEPLLKNTISVSTFSVEEFGNPISILAVEPSFSVVRMKFNQNFETGKLYHLIINQDITDCVGNNIPQNTSFRFAIADSVIENDLIINEILFNPYTYGKDFIEFYNRSEKIIDLKNLWYSDLDDAGVIKNSYRITEISRLVLPGEYVALSTDIQNIKDNYYVPYPENLYQVLKIPSMPDDKGHVLLTDRVLNKIDEVKYNKNQHYKLLASQDGVSLERINPDRPSNDITNWHSASQTVGFATPGYKNSQYSDQLITQSIITVNPKVFSPDNDGFDDILNIRYSLNELGYTATMAIYDADGRFVTFIVNNQLLDVEGNFVWDGFDSANKLCQPGIYIIYVEMFNLSGNKIVEKLPIVLSRKN